MARQSVLLLITELDPGGAERVIFDLATGLARFDVAVAALDGRGEYAARLRARGVEVIDLGAPTTRHILGAVLRLRRLLRTGRFALLNTHLFHAGIVGRLAAAGTGVPVIGTCHIVERRRCGWRFYLDRLTACLARREVCVSAAVRDFQRSHTRLKDSFYPVIENGIDLARFAPVSVEQRAQLRRRLGLPQHGLLTGFLGRFDRQKGVDILLRALEQPALLAGAPFHLALAGYGPLEQSLRRLALEVATRCGRTVRDAIPANTNDGETGRERKSDKTDAAGVTDGAGAADEAGGACGTIVWAGYQADPAAFLQCLDVCVIPSRWEGFGLVAVEAQACGVPVIAARVDSLPEVMAGGGLLCEPEDPAGLAALLAALTESAQARARLAAGAVLQAQRYDRRRMVEAYEALYTDTIMAYSEPTADQQTGDE